MITQDMYKTIWLGYRDTTDYALVLETSKAWWMCPADIKMRIYEVDIVSDPYTVLSTRIEENNIIKILENKYWFNFDINNFTESELNTLYYQAFHTNPFFPWYYFHHRPEELAIARGIDNSQMALDDAYNILDAAIGFISCRNEEDYEDWEERLDLENCKSWEYIEEFITNFYKEYVDNNVVSNDNNLVYKHI